MDITSRDGSLTLPLEDVETDRQRYTRITNLDCPLTAQHMIDMIATWEDYVNDDEFVQHVDKRAHEIKLASETDTEHSANLSNT
jgi:hypothetical protein